MPRPELILPPKINVTGGPFGTGDSPYVMSGKINLWIEELEKVLEYVDSVNADMEDVETAVQAIDAAMILAQKWASEAEDVVVADGEYSSKHYSIKASEYAQGISDALTTVSNSLATIQGIGEDVSDAYDAIVLIQTGVTQALSDAQAAASSASSSASSASTSADTATTKASEANQSAIAASGSASSASTSANTATTKASEALQSAQDASDSEDAASLSASAASDFADAAGASATAASISASAASDSADDAAQSALDAQAAVSSLNLPAIQTGDALKLLRVKSTEDGYEYATVSLPSTSDDLAEGSTNLYMTTSERTKLSGIASGATANQADSYLLDRANHTGTQAISTVSGLSDALAGKASATHTHLWAEITDKPSTFTPSAHTHLWAEITDKPATFPPDAHNHDDRYYTETEINNFAYVNAAGAAAAAPIQSLTGDGVGGTAEDVVLTFPTPVEIGAEVAWVTTTANSGTLTGLQVIWLADTTSARNRTLDATGIRLQVKDTTGSAETNNITLTAPGGQTINGNATETVDVDYGWVEYVRSGTNWVTIGGQA
jgi:hypothetical protein